MTAGSPVRTWSAPRRGSRRKSGLTEGGKRRGVPEEREGARGPARGIRTVHRAAAVPCHRDESMAGAARGAVSESGDGDRSGGIAKGYAVDRAIEALVRLRSATR